MQGFVDRIDVAACCIRLPDLNPRTTNRRAIRPQYAPGEIDELTQGASRSARNMREVEIMMARRTHREEGAKRLLGRRAKLCFAGNRSERKGSGADADDYVSSGNLHCSPHDRGAFVCVVKPRPGKLSRVISVRSKYLPFRDAGGVTMHPNRDLPISESVEERTMRKEPFDNEH